MNTQQDFEELLRLLEKHNAEYLVVGCYAVAFYGYPRFTKDIDLFYDITASNIDAIRNALFEFGFSEQELPVDSFFEKGSIIKFGIDPVRVDLLNEIDGVAFEDAYENHKRGRYGNVTVNFIGKNELIKNKKASNRTQDKLDLENLG
jgi:hypothetical protein